jgi:hypothetical protein
MAHADEDMFTIHLYTNISLGINFSVLIKTELKVTYRFRNFQAGTLNKKEPFPPTFFPIHYSLNIQSLYIIYNRY